MKCKNTRSSGKTLGVALVAWTWEQTLIAASALGQGSHSVISKKPGLFMKKNFVYQKNPEVQKNIWKQIHEVKR